MEKWYIILLVIFTLGLTSSCAPKANDGASGPGALGVPSDAALTGKISGANFVFKSGSAIPDFSDPNKYFVKLYESLPTGDICTYYPPFNENLILFSIPKAAATYNLNLTGQMTLTFFTGHGANLNDVATNGSIVIQDVNATLIGGKLKALFNADNNADGAFTATVCP